MDEQTVNVRGVPHSLPALSATREGVFTIADNRKSRIPISPSSDYLVVHAATGRLLPALTGAIRTRREVAAYAQRMEDLGAFDATTGLPVEDTDIRAQAVALSRGSGL